MTSRTIELGLLLGAFIIAQWPNIAFASHLSADDWAKSAGSVATVAGILAIYRAWKSKE